MSAFDAIFDELEIDVTLAAILTGGLYDGRTVTDISRQATPLAYDAYQELKPCGLLKMESQAPTGPHPDGSRLFVVLWLYQQNGSTEIDAARERAYQLLHRTTLGGSDRLWDVRHANDILGIEIQALGVPAIMSRYVATVNRSAG